MCENSSIFQISVYRTLGGSAALGPRIYEGAVTAEGGDWGSPNILPPASFHSATKFIVIALAITDLESLRYPRKRGWQGVRCTFKQLDKLQFITFYKLS